jgi:hypothetical protein
MTESGGQLFLTQADFARRRGVSRKAVTSWKQKGLLTIRDDGLINVEETEWNLDQRPAVYRGGVTHRPVRGRDQNNSDGPAVAKPARRQAQQDAPDDAADPASEGFDPDGENLPLAEAVRRKENYLSLLRKREFEISNREWVRIEDVGAQVEQEYATVRERLLTIPGKIADRLVGKDRGEIEATLRQEITEALHELHDPAGLLDRASALGKAGAGETGV